MQILLTNDDGIFAPGLAAIYKELIKIGDVAVAAPADCQSAASHRITIFEPLICKEVEVDGLFTGYSIEGSPADCVKLAVKELCKNKIDLVVSGINSGANAGINVYYSGTVAAAVEGVLLNVRAVALSTVREENIDYETAASYCIDEIKKLMPIETGAVININIPQLSKGPPKGAKIVPQAGNGFNEYYIKKQNEHGQTVYQLAADKHENTMPLTDIAAIEDGYITITALSADMTNKNRMRQLEQKRSDLGEDNG